MGFLLRCIFWFSLVLLFLPIDIRQQAPEADPVNPFEAVVAVREAAQDIGNLCVRQPEVCVTAHNAAQTIATRAREGLRIAQELVERESATSAGTDAAPATGSVPPSQ